MRIRSGFVSNSSSLSFTVDVDSYDSVFDLARSMLDVIITLDEREYNESSKQWCDCLRSIKKTLDEKESGGMDPNTPVVFPSCNYDSYIVKSDEDNVFYVDSCNNHNYWNDLDGVMYGDGMGFGLDEKHFFYDATLDIMAKRPSYDAVTSRWCDEHHAEKFVLEDSRIICPVCDKDELEIFKVSTKSGRKSAVDIDKIIDRLVDE